MNSLNLDLKVIIADDHEMVRQGLRGLFQSDARIQIIAEASNGLELLDLLKKSSCEIVILDINMPEKGGLEVIKEIGIKYPSIRVLVLTMHRDLKYFQQTTCKKNVYGYILKDEAFDRLLDAVKRIEKGERVFSSKVQKAMLDDYQAIRKARGALDDLTRREKEVIRLAASGLMNKEIANQLFISTRTVETHRANVMEKLRLSTFADLVKFAVANGLTTDESEEIS